MSSEQRQVLWRAMFARHPLHVAAIENDCAAVRSLLAAGADVDERQGSESDVIVHVPLSLAVTFKHHETIKALLDAGANVGAMFASSETGAKRLTWRTVIEYVLSCLDESVLMTFIACGVRFDAAGSPAVRLAPHWAAQNSDERILSLLLKHGADCNVRSPSGQLASHVAARNANAAVIGALIAAGGQCDSADNWGEFPCHLAASNVNEAVLKRLIDAGVPCDVVDRVSVTPCFRAAINPNAAVIALLINAGCNFDHRDQNDTTPSHCAARNPYELVLAQLLAAKANVGVVDRTGETPLTLAAANRNEKVIEMLIAAGATAAGARLPRARALLHEAAINPNELVLKHVISLGGDIDVRDLCNRTPCHFAAEFGGVASVEALVAAGASVGALDVFGSSLCHYAARNDRPDVLRLVLSLGADVNLRTMAGVTPILAAAQRARYDNLVVLVNAGAAVDAISAQGGSVLHSLALARGAEDDVQAQVKRALPFLLRHGASFRVRNQYGQSPMHGASAAAIALLFAHGADVDLLDNCQFSPLSLAFTSRSGNSANEVVTFLAAGADFSLVNREAFREDLVLLAIACGATSSVNVSSTSVAQACKAIAERQWELFRLRAFHVCVGLESLALPALLTCEILSNMFAPRESLVSFYRMWNVATTVKHHFDQNMNMF